VNEVAVVGVPDEAWGERVVAAVVPSVALSGNEPAIGDEEAGEALRAWLKLRIAAYKVPKQVVFRAALPRNAMGKVQKPALLAELAGAAAKGLSR
jgi:malonyl-CoA/methylmalonyl-CoA synthetase